MSLAQRPVLFSADRSSAAMQQLVTLRGNDLGSNPSQVNVFFGGVKGEIKSVSQHLILVKTPAGATFAPIQVTNLSNGLTGYLPGQFFINYSGDHGINATTFSTQTDFQAQSGLYDLCVCDFNDDRKPDVATASSTSNIITLFKNSSTPGTVTLTPQDFMINARTLHSRCGDLNGDGRSDIVLTEASDGDRVFVLKNNGNFSFSLQSMRLTGIKVKQISIRDLDLDGKPEIIVTNTGGNVLTVLPNTSTGSTISFSAPRPLPIPGASSTDALAVGDLNDDGRPEIITSQYQADSENKLFIAVNRGALSFDEFKVMPVNRAVSSIRIADIDADEKPDIIIARLTGSDVSVYLNNSAQSISFKDPLFFATETLPVGMDFGDFDGDGKPDIAVGSIAKSISILNNNAPATGQGALSAAVKVGTTYTNRNLSVADMDGDGKPDIIFTSVDDFSGIPVPASKVSVVRNQGCMVPVLSPAEPLTVCSGNPLRITATASGGNVYQWHREGTVPPLKSGTEEFLDVTSSGTYRVTALGAGNCSKESATIDISFVTPSNPLAPGDAGADSNSPVCSDNTLILNVSDLGATEYRWRGPNGFTATSATPALERDDFSQEDAGVYIVDMIAGNCLAETDSTIVESITVPDFTLSPDENQYFCNGSSRTLTIVPAAGEGFGYQWYDRATGPISGATLSSFAASAAGEYYAVITPANAGCAPRETAAVTVTELTAPVADFDEPGPGCIGQPLTFSHRSTGDATAKMLFQWTFGDGKTSTGENPQTTYNASGVFNVTLSLSYEGISGCTSSKSGSVSIVAPQTPQITASATSACEGDEVLLSVNASFTSISWSTGSGTAEIEVTSPGDYEVHTVDASGCAASDEITIAPKPVPDLTASAAQTAIASGQTVQLHAYGADAYSWTPGKTLNDSTIADPVASPRENTIYTVTGSLDGGCDATANVSVQVSGEVMNIKVPALFSPNGDTFNETLVIEGVENYPDCTLTIFDRRGGKVYSTMGYKNNWDGTFNGARVPEGLYYYVFGCPNGKSNTGTVAVIR
jgi:gliding motility-associated-like protein